MKSVEAEQSQTEESSRTNLNSYGVAEIESSLLNAALAAVMAGNYSLARELIEQSAYRLNCHHEMDVLLSRHIQEYCYGWDDLGRAFLSYKFHRGGIDLSCEWPDGYQHCPYYKLLCERNAEMASRPQNR